MIQGRVTAGATEIVGLLFVRLSPPHNRCQQFQAIMQTPPTGAPATTTTTTPATTTPLSGTTTATTTTAATVSFPREITVRQASGGVTPAVWVPAAVAVIVVIIGAIANARVAKGNRQLQRDQAEAQRKEQKEQADKQSAEQRDQFLAQSNQQREQFNAQATQQREQFERQADRQAEEAKAQALRQERSEHLAWLRDRRFEAYSEALTVVDITRVVQAQVALNRVASSLFLSVDELHSFRETRASLYRLRSTARTFGDNEIARNLLDFALAVSLIITSHSKGDKALTPEILAECARTESSIADLHLNLIAEIQRVIASPQPTE